MEWINARVAGVSESATLAVMAKAAQLKAEGRSIIDLSTGEPDCGVASHVREAAIRAINEGKSRYTPAAGIGDLREAIAQKLKGVNGIECAAAQVIVTNGGKQALHEVFDVVLEPGDEVIIPAPYWVSFPAMVQLSGGTPVIVSTKPENGYRLAPEDLARAITPRTKAFVFNSPSNPVGVAYTAEEVRALGEVLKAHERVLVVSDEVYERITYDGFKFRSFAAVMPELASRTVTVNALSKSYAMTGWRVGYATGPKEIISAMIRHQSQTTSNINAIAQYAALAALKGPDESVTAMVQQFDGRIERMLSVIEGIPSLHVAGKPQGAFYLFVRIDRLLAAHGARFKGSAEVATYLLDEVGLAVVPGAAFGDDGAFRISVGASDKELGEAAERLTRAFGTL